MNNYNTYRRETEKELRGKLFKQLWHFKTEHSEFFLDTVKHHKIVTAKIIVYET